MPGSEIRGFGIVCLGLLSLSQSIQGQGQVVMRLRQGLLDADGFFVMLFGHRPLPGGKGLIACFHGQHRLGVAPAWSIQGCHLHILGTATGSDEDETA